MVFGFKDRDPANKGFQFLEDLSTAYWYSQVLFTALELKLFGLLDQGGCDLESLARTAQCKSPELARLMAVLARIGLVTLRGDKYYNNPAASRYLVPDKTDYMGDFFLYRLYMRPRWDALTQKLTGRKKEPAANLSNSNKVLNYTAAMDTLARQKAKQIRKLLEREVISGSILDIGGGAGSLARALKELPGVSKAFVIDLPVVIATAYALYPAPKDWKKIEAVGADFRTHEFGRTFSLVCLSNFLHAYGTEEARELLLKAVSLVKKDGWLLIHDYFPDRLGTVPQKGPLYDLNMLVNTYNGVCHDAHQIVAWMADAGFKSIAVKDLDTDTALILARKQDRLSLPGSVIEDFAVALGFNHITAIAPKDVVTVVWAREKCRYGCSGFGQGLQCPPNGMDNRQTRQLLNGYTRAYLIRGTPPGHAFHKALLALEKKAFLEGYHKAFVFGAGPCAVCQQCPDDGHCRFPELARPSMEGSGIDVYKTARNAGIRLQPVKDKGGYVTYVGLILVE